MFIEILLGIVVFYLLCGFIFLIPFLIRGVHVIDEGARGSSIGFRFIIIPGVIVFWVVLLMQWIKVRRQPSGGS